MTILLLFRARPLPGLLPKMHSQKCVIGSAGHRESNEWTVGQVPVRAVSIMTETHRPAVNPTLKMNGFINSSVGGSSHLLIASALLTEPRCRLAENVIRSRILPCADEGGFAPSDYPRCHPGYAVLLHNPPAFRCRSYGSCQGKSESVYRVPFKAARAGSQMRTMRLSLHKAAGLE